MGLALGAPCAGILPQLADPFRIHDRLFVEITLNVQNQRGNPGADKQRRRKPDQTGRHILAHQTD